MTRLFVVIPCYNETEVLPETTRRLKLKMEALMEQGAISPESHVVYVDDGSKDGTWELIHEIHLQDPLFQGIRLAHNKGHQNALLAGMMEVREQADCIISMDADLQDDIGAMDAMLDHFEDGCQVVYGVRSNRKKDTFFKKHSAQAYYKFMRLMGTELVYNHADYRLLGRKALDSLADYKEVNLFLRGIVPELGFKTAVVYYERAERFAGVSKYPLKKMLSFAMEGITSFSVEPLKLISRIGILLSLLSVTGLIYALVAKISGTAVDGWTAIVCSIWLLGGIQLLCLGVLGTYVGKIYNEVKARPRYEIDENTMKENEN